jgi:hypothetical protein
MKNEQKPTTSRGWVFWLLCRMSQVNSCIAIVKLAICICSVLGFEFRLVGFSLVAVSEAPGGYPSYCIVKWAIRICSVLGFGFPLVGFSCLLFDGSKSNIDVGFAEI